MRMDVESLAHQQENPNTCPSNMQKTGRKTTVFFPAWWHIMQQTETGSQSTEQSCSFKLKLQFTTPTPPPKKTESKMVSHPRGVTLSGSWYSQRVGVSTFYFFIAVMFNQHPGEVGRPLLSTPSRRSILRSALPSLSPTQRGLPSDVNHAVN